MRYLLLILSLLVFSCDPETPPSPQPPVVVPPAPEGWVYGITLDNIDNLDAIYDSLKSFSKKTTVRIVFDEGVAASYYLSAVKKLSEVSFIMGELLDSFYVKNYTLEKYKNRAIEYYNTLGSYVTVWEVGNEISGDWLGAGAIQKAEAAFNEIESRGGRTALTLYYNKDCEDNNGAMLVWAAKNISDNLSLGLDWVTVSYYEDDCNNRIVPREEWVNVFSSLQKLFPVAVVLMGEVGSKYSDRKEATMRRYYPMRLPEIDRFKGGFFWWYGYQDLVPKTKPLWMTFNSLL